MNKLDTQPLVSICIPTFNGAQFIAEAMDSAIAQTYPNLEIIVSDDASTDETLAIIETYRSKTTIPIHIFHHEPRGIGANWNHCIKKANGEYIKFLFQDDVLEPTCIEKMVAIIEADNRIGLIACKRDFIVEASFKTQGYEKWIAMYGNLQDGLNLEFKHGVGYVDSSLFRSDLLFRSPLNKIGEPSTFLFKRTLVDNIGYFREDLHQVLDYEFCYRILKTKHIAIMSEKLVNFRLHDRQTTVINKDNETYGIDHEIYQQILYKHYFWYLNNEIRKVLLRKYNKLARFLYDMVDILKRAISKLTK